MVHTRQATCKVCGEVIKLGRDNARAYDVMACHIRTRHSAPWPAAEYFTMEDLEPPEPHC